MLMNLRLLRDLELPLFMKIFLVNYPLWNYAKLIEAYGDTDKERWPVDIFCGFVNTCMETFASWKKPENFFLYIQLYVNFVN